MTAMHPLALLVLVAFGLVIVLILAVWLTLLAFRTPPEPEPEPEASRRTPRPDVSNDAVRGAKAPRKHAPVDVIAAPSEHARSEPARPERSGRAPTPPPRSGDGRDRPDSWRTRSGGTPSAPSWRARTRERATEPPPPPDAVPSAPDRGEPVGRASRWSWPGGEDRAARRDADGDAAPEPRDADEGAETRDGVRVRDRSDDRRRRDEEAFARFLDPKRRDDF